MSIVFIDDVIKVKIATKKLKNDQSETKSIHQSVI